MRVVHVLRKPLAGASVAANALAHGAGALHIDACRVGDDARRGDKYRDGPPKGGGTGLGFAFRHDQPWVVKPGRWPANLIFRHLPGCERVGKTCVLGCPVADFDRQWEDAGVLRTSASQYFFQVGGRR